VFVESGVLPTCAALPSETRDMRRSAGALRAHRILERERHAQVLQRAGVVQLLLVSLVPATAAAHDREQELGEALVACEGVSGLANGRPGRSAHSWRASPGPFRPRARSCAGHTRPVSSTSTAVMQQQRHLFLAPATGSQRERGKTA
jgi:hypothetical protein